MRFFSALPVNSNTISALIGVVLSAILLEYVKLWYFKGIRPWDARRLQAWNLERMENDLKEREKEQDAYSESINRALARAEKIEGLYRVQQVLLANPRIIWTLRDCQINGSDLAFESFWALQSYLSAEADASKAQYKML